MSQPETKLSAVVAAMDAGDWPRALRLAARFQQLGEERNAILDAHTALTNPRWIAAMHKDGPALIEAGKAALVQKYRKRAA